MKPVAQGLDLGCPDCGGGLPGNAFALICACGRPMEVDEIVALKAILRDWETKLDDLRDLSADPRLEGFESIRESFHRRIRQLEDRIELLRHAARN